MKQKTKKNIGLLILGLAIILGTSITWYSLDLTGYFWKYLLLGVGGGIFAKGWRDLEQQEKNHEL